MVDAFLKYLEGEWKVIGQAPLTFLIVLTILGGIIWFVAKRAAALQVANLRSSLELSDRQIAYYKDKLAGASPDEAAKAQIAKSSNYRRT